MKFSLILKIFIRVYFFILETTISLVVKWSKSKQKKNRRFITSTFNSSISFFSFGRQTCMIKTHFFFKFNVIIKRRIKDTTYTIQSLFFPPPVIILQRGGKGKKKIFHSPICIFLTGCGFSTIVAVCFIKSSVIIIRWLVSLAGWQKTRGTNSWNSSIAAF